MPRRVTKLSESPVARRLALTRLALGYRTQAELAAAAGIPPNVYNPWEKGSRDPSMRGARILCDRFDLTFDWLFHGKMDGLPHSLAMRIIELEAKPSPLENGIPEPWIIRGQ